MAHGAQLDDEMIDDLLHAAFRQYAVFQIAFGVNIEERAHPAERHRRAVLLLVYREIGKIHPLHRLFEIRCGTGNIAAVHRRHLL